MSLKLLIYNQNCFDLARSIICKSDLLAVETEMQINPIDYRTTPRTEWLYYLNLAGDYHILNERMVITSHDTLEEIPFNKEALVNHTITRSKYTATSSLTKELIRKYPNNAALIQGIIYSVPMETILAADELDIIAYDNSLINVGECGLINLVQEAIHQKFGAALNKDYIDVEAGYVDVIFWKLYQSLPYEVKYARMTNHRTAWASEFDMWTYINTHIYLEDLSYALTHADIVYLYKNIDRLARNSGSNNVLMELITRFLTDRSIDTYQLNIIRDLIGMDTEEPTNRIKLIEYKVGGYGHRDASLMDYIRLGDVRSHGKLEDYAGMLERRMLHSDDQITTRELKILELLEDSSDTQLLLVDIDLFVQGVARGVYDSRHTIINHITGETHRLTSLEAIILYMYVVGCKIGNKPELVGVYNTNLVPVSNIPTVDVMMSDYGLSIEQANYLTSIVPVYPKTRILNTMFTEYVSAYKESLPVIKRFMLSATNYDNQIQISQLEGSLFEFDNIKLLPEPVEYSRWLASLSINLKDFKASDWVVMEDTILRNVFGIDLMERTSHRSTGIAELLKRFCSYRLNVTARADSANMINYRLAPLQINSTDSEIGLLDTGLIAPVTLNSSVTYQVMTERIELGTIDKQPSSVEDVPLRIDYDFVDGIMTSTVISNELDSISLSSYLNKPEII